ncbi:hypothetical protein Sru01_44690 [Sphaerisporangium rufum]|uniref:Uncharacterized protein n=1 Tax=Sphaerisporangium rufum TaxID=1381558 RepID=A0A919R4D6_9ACTN|nr:DUF6506 family protein [Sphaerisporangium rufum]GII79487.1 hypothetical protein Sru01_44690 [Sphaerisporangium rufum]
MPENRVIVYEEADADQRIDVMAVQTARGRTRVRAVAEAAQMVGLVASLVAEGVDQVELCGGFGAVWHAEARRATGGKAAVGAIYYGFESLTSVASYKERFEAGEPLSEAFIVVHGGADPEADRVVHEKEGGGRTIFVAVPDVNTAAEMAAKPAGESQLIELYGTEGPDEAEPVIRAVDAKVPVGVSGYRR